jgi:hypothetical protein
MAARTVDHPGTARKHAKSGPRAEEVPELHDHRTTMHGGVDGATPSSLGMVHGEGG